MPPKFGLLLFCALVGFFAGGVRAARREAAAVDRARTKAVSNPFLDVLGQSAASGLAALVAAAVALDRMPDHIYLVIAAAGLAGWGGALLLDLGYDAMAHWIQRRIDAAGGQPSPNDSTPPPPAPSAKKDEP